MPGRSIDVDKLCKSIHNDRQVLEFARRQRRDLVQQMIGSHCLEGGTNQKVPVNLIALYIQLISRDLVPKDPRAMLATFQRQHKPVVAAMEGWINKEVERIHLQETLQRVVVDAMVGVGVAMVALADPAMAASMAWNLKAGEPFVESIDLDDWGYDTHANNFQHAAYMFHRYRVPLDVVKHLKIYSKERKELTPSTDPQYNREGDERIGAMGKGNAGFSNDEFEDMVDLWQVYLARHRLILTLEDDGSGAPCPGTDGKPLRQIRWVGPDEGPYHLLGFGTIPGNAMPLAPLQNLVDLHDLVNNIFRKLDDQSRRCKQLSLVVGGNAEDGAVIRDAADGTMPVVSRVDSVIPFVSAGPNAQLMAMFERAELLFDKFAGNLSSIGGLAAQSKTATQDELIAGSSSKTVADMGQRTLAFTSSVMRSLLWFHHHHPTKVMRTAQEIQGMPGGAIPQYIRPAGAPGLARNIPFDDIDIKIDPYSMTPQTPQSKLQNLNQIVTTIVIPMMQLLQQQGINFDINAYLVKIGQLLDIPDLAEILTITEPPREDTPSGSPDKAPMPGMTERKYTRTSMPGRTEKGDAMNRINALMNVDPGGDPNRNGKPVGA